MSRQTKHASLSESTKPPLLIFSPLPPVENGIADYCAELLPGLSKQWDITLVIDNHLQKPSFSDHYYEVLHVAQFIQREAEYSDANFLYQLGNNPDHDYIIPVLCRHPGVVVLHDLSLHHLVDQMTLRYGDVAAYSRLLVAEFGYQGSILAKQFEERRLRERAMFYELPMIRRIAACSKAIIVHSMYAKTKVLAQDSSVPVELISHHLAESAIRARSEFTSEEAKISIGVRADEILLVSLGFITKAKQIEPVLQVLAHLRTSLPKFRYILAGQDHCDIFSVIRKYDLQDVVEVTGYLDEADFYKYCIAADVVINLRYPTGGETSGTLIRALGVAACVVVVDIGPFSEFPDEICSKIPWNDNFEITLARKLRELMSDRGLRKQLSDNAARHFLKNNNLEQSVQEYNRILQQNHTRPKPMQPLMHAEFMSPSFAEATFAKMSRESRSSVPLWFRERMFPLAAPAKPRDVLIIESLDAKKLVCKHLGYSEQDVIHILPPAWQHATFTPELRFTCILFNAELSLQENRFDHDIRVLHGLLHPGAFLIITVTHLSAKRSELGTDSLNRLGFTVLQSISAPEYASFAIDTSEADHMLTARNERCIQVKKYTEFIPNVPVNTKSRSLCEGGTHDR